MHIINLVIRLLPCPNGYWLNRVCGGEKGVWTFVCVRVGVFVWGGISSRLYSCCVTYLFYILKLIKTLSLHGQKYLLLHFHLGPLFSTPYSFTVHPFVFISLSYPPSITYHFLLYVFIFHVLFPRSYFSKYFSANETMDWFTNILTFMNISFLATWLTYKEL